MGVEGAIESICTREWRRYVYLGVGDFFTFFQALLEKKS
jgi:hypothetical protein